jgi:hypothetical protein
MVKPDAADERATAAERSAREDDDWTSVVLVPVWIGLFMGSWWGIERLLLLAPRGLSGSGMLQVGATALADARGVIAPVLGLLLGTYAIALLGEVRRRLCGEPSPCEAPKPARERARSGVPKALRDESAIAQVERELDREVRAERSGVRRAALAVNNRLMVGALRRRGYNDDIGCSGIVFILVAATVALPFAAEGLARLTGFVIAGQLGVLLWFALAYGGFCVRWVWKRGCE